MIKFFTTKTIHWVIFALFLFATKGIFAKDNFNDFNSNSFYKSNLKRQFFSLGGGYKSDYNSREYEVLSGYKYKSNRFIHEIDFLHEVIEAGTTTIPMRKTKELYDFEASSRMKLGPSANYLNLYSRTRYDERSDFYYDVANAAGVGRLFFNDKLESSINLGYNEVKNFNSEIIVVGILRANFKINEDIGFSTRGILTRAEKTYDEEIKNILSFRLQKNLFFELIHKYERNRYLGSSKKLGTYRINHTSRESYARFKYNF